MSFLDPVLNPLLQLPVLWIVIIISLLISLAVVLIYKFTTNQDLMKQLKAEMKELQKEMKQLKDNPQKMMEVQRQSMQTNLKYMSHSLKSTLFTLIPILLIFGWMTQHLAYEPILPEQEFTTTVLFEPNTRGNITLKAPDGIAIDGSAVKEVNDGKAVWVLIGKEGSYILNFEFQGNNHQKDVLISKERVYAPPIMKIRDSPIKSISIDHKQEKILNLFGWRIGWLGSYILFSLVFSILLRKVFKVY